MVKFHVTKEEAQLVYQIADRAVKIARKAGLEYPKLEAIMDIEACHSNGTPLKLAKLLAAEDFDFSHDVFGIRRHIDRETGEIQDGFLPRYAR